MMLLPILAEFLLSSGVAVYVIINCGGKKKAPPPPKAEVKPSAEVKSSAPTPSAAAPAPAPAGGASTAGGAPPAVLHNCAFVNAKTFQKVLNKIDTFIFDADGVLWLGDNVIEGSPEFIEYLHNEGKQLIIMTNNTTKARKNYAEKLSKLGYPSYFNHEILVNPSAVVADMLQWQGVTDNGKKVFIIGEKGLRDELDLLNIPYFGHGPVDTEPLQGDAPYLFDYELEVPVEEVGAVVVAYEKHFHYLKLMDAVNYLKDPECLFLATNLDETTPGPNPDLIIPDAGPLVAAISKASGRKATNVGKPSLPAFDYICRKWDLSPKRTMMIGDRTNTDVKFGRDHGLKTLLVLSGVHQVEDIERNIKDNRHDMVPHYFAKKLGALVPETSPNNSSRRDNNNASSRRRSASPRLASASSHQTSTSTRQIS